MQSNYERLINRISKVSAIEKHELEKKIEEKRTKLSGMISKEGAAQIVAAELGISFDQEKLKIDELLPGMRKVNIIAKILKISPIKTFQTKSGKESKVVNLQIADESSNIRAVLWDTNHIELIEKGEIAEGDVIEIINASIRDNELHLGSFSNIKLSDQIFQTIVTEKHYQEKKISDVKRGDNIKIRAFIVQIFEPRFFLVCAECGKRITENFCQEHQLAEPEKRIILNMLIDDGTENIRAVFFNESANFFGFSQDQEKNQFKAEALLGKEMIFFGNVRQNTFFNNLEIITEKIEEVNIDELLEKFEG